MIDGDEVIVKDNGKSRDGVMVEDEVPVSVGEAVIVAVIEFSCAGKADVKVNVVDVHVLPALTPGLEIIGL